MSFYGFGLDVPYIKKGTTIAKIGKAVADNSGRCGDAYALQEMLKDLGYYKGDIDGQLGSQSIAAWQSFCKDYGVSTSGATFPQKTQCQAIMDSWEASQSPGTPESPPPLPGGSSASQQPVNVTVTPKPKAKSSSKSGMAKFWEDRSTAEKAALIGGGLFAVAGTLFALMHKSSSSAATATANRRSRRNPTYEIKDGRETVAYVKANTKHQARSKYLKWAGLSEADEAKLGRLSIRTSGGYVPQLLIP